MMNANIDAHVSGLRIISDYSVQDFVPGINLLSHLVIWDFHFSLTLNPPFSHCLPCSTGCHAPPTCPFRFVHISCQPAFSTTCLALQVQVFIPRVNILSNLVIGMFCFSLTLNLPLLVCSYQLPHFLQPPFSTTCLALLASITPLPALFRFIHVSCHISSNQCFPLPALLY